jgi:CheY-like chemotaxis protein
MPKKPKILLAEDDPCLSLYVQVILSRWDREVLVEQSAEGAIQRAATFMPDICLLGFVTPGMNGAKAAIELLKVSQGTHIVLFNESVPADILSDLKARRYNFQTLATPFDEEELRDLCFPAPQPEVE